MSEQQPLNDRLWQKLKLARECGQHAAREVEAFEAVCRAVEHLSADEARRVLGAVAALRDLTL